MKFSEKVFRLIDLKNPPELLLRRRDAVSSLADLRTSEGWMDSNVNETLSGLILLWHDHWTESHAIAQSHEGVRDFDLLHAIGHRREGDFGNSAFWFQEAGHHPMYEKLSYSVNELIGKNLELKRILLPKGKWDSQAFVKSVKQNPDNSVLRSIQSLEFQCFLDFLVSDSK